MTRSEILSETVSALQNAGFEVYYNDGLRKYFDLIAVGEVKIFVKILSNIDNLGAEEGRELSKFARAFSAQSFIVGEKTGILGLREDVIYHRHGNSCVRPATLGKILRGETVSRFTKRGQLLVGIDGEALRKAREKKGISKDELARILDCSGKTVHRIEKHNRIGEELYERLLDFLGRDLEVGKIELKEPGGNAEMRISDPIKKEIVKEYFRLKLDNVTFETAIDFALEERPLITPVSRSESELRAKQKLAKGLGDILDCGIIHITKEERSRRLPCISFKQLHYISTKKEIFEKSD